MTALYNLQTTFNRGEISPLLGARADIDFWRQSLLYCRNWQVLIHGGIRRRSGTKFIAECHDSTAMSRLMPFVFSQTQSYVLEVSGAATGKFRFLAQRGIVESGGSPYTVTHTYSEANLFELSYAQFNDVAYIAHENYAPATLTRSAETSWALADYVFEDGPYLDINTTGTTLTPSGTGHATPAMTSNTSPSGTVSSSGGGANAYRVFDRSKTNSVSLDSGSEGYVRYDFGAGNAVAVDAYWLVAPDNNPQYNDMISQWELRASNDASTWAVLDSRDAQTGWAGSETRFYEFNNKTAYRYYELKFSGGGGADGVNSDVSELAMHLAADEQTPFNLTASSTTGINGGNGFQTTDVGRHIRLLGSDGVWRWAKIVSRSSDTVVTIRLYGHALPNTSSIVNWRMGAFSEESGWPGCVGLYKERLFFGRTNSQPVSVFGSKQGVFNNHGINDPLLPTDAVNITLLSSQMNELLWLSDDEDLITGSSGQIRSIGPSDITTDFSATNVTQRKGPTSGAERIQPISVGGVTLYVGAGAKKIRELVLGDQNRYVAPELSLIGEHYFKSGIVDWAFSEKPDPTIYAVTGDGLLVAITYDREQKALGFSRHDVGGTIESVAVINGTTAGYDDVYLVVNRTIDGSTVRYIEVLEKPFDPETDDVEDAFFVDCGLTYSGASATTITGLDHLEGESVVALAGGNVVTGLTVTSGQVTLPYAVTKAHIGLSFKSRAVTLPIAGPGTDGTIFGRRINITGGSVDVYGAGALKVGNYADGRWTPELTEVLLSTGDELFGSEVELQSGFKPCEMEGSWTEGGGSVVMETESPLPCIIRAFAFQTENEP